MKTRFDNQNAESVAAIAVHAVATVVLRLVVGAGGEVGVVVEGVAAYVGIVAVREELLDFPVVGALTDGEFEVFLGDSIPELERISI